MTIQQVVASLQNEKQGNISSRYPCRAIMVKNIAEYCQLLSELKAISDIRMIKSSEIFPSFDVMPKYEVLESSSYENKWVILTGVSEYLRLFSKKEATDRRFASLWGHQFSASNTGRIIIPLWGCEAQWFDASINLTGDLRQEDFYYDCSGPNACEQNMNLLVLSGMFEPYLNKLDSLRGNLKIGLQDWFEYWENPSPDCERFVLLTKRSNSIATTNGVISVRVLNDTLSFIQESMPGARGLSCNECSKEMQDVLFEYALKNVPLDNALLSIFNVSVFSGADIMGKWNALPITHKHLVALWLQLHPDGSYLHHCFAVSSSVLDIPNLVMHEIFKLRDDKPEWIPEFKKLALVMALKPDAEYFSEVDAIPEYEARLEYITNGTREEHIYLLRMVGKWMRTDPQQVMACDKLKEIYPELSAYLDSDSATIPDSLGQYMALYKAYKLENTLPDDENVFIDSANAESFECRYAVLSDYVDKSTVVLWVDALGVEWLPLLRWGLQNNCDATIQHEAVALATLPSETIFNKQWETMNTPHDKLDKLDKLAHKGVIDEPDYYACIEEQLAFVAGIHKRVSALLKTYHRVIITGDHGASRLAARFFHARTGLDAPKGATVYCHGRYCSIEDDSTVTLPYLLPVNGKDGTKYLVFSNYDHFKSKGFAAGGDDDNAIYGELHGGASPEEMLVSVVVVDSNKEIPLTATWNIASVKISMKKAKFTLELSKPISQLIVKAAGILGEVSPTGDGTKWTVVFTGIKPDTYHAEVYADSHIISLPDITIKPALGGGDGDLP